MGTLKSLSVLLVLAAILGTAIYLAYNLPYFRVTQAQVTGNQIISLDEINAVMGVAGQPVFTLKPDEIETCSSDDRLYAGSREAATRGLRKMA